MESLTYSLSSSLHLNDNKDEITQADTDDRSDILVLVYDFDTIRYRTNNIVFDTSKGSLHFKGDIKQIGVSDVIKRSRKDSSVWNETLADNEILLINYVTCRLAYPDLILDSPTKDEVKMGKNRLLLSTFVDDLSRMTYFHNRQLKSLHVGALLGRHGLRPILLSEMNVGDPSLKIKKIGNDTYDKAIIGSVDLICLDENDKIILCDLKTSATTSMISTQHIFCKYENAMQLYLYGKMIKKMFKVHLHKKIEIGGYMIIGMKVSNVNPGVDKSDKMLSMYLWELKINPETILSETSTRKSITIESK